MIYKIYEGVLVLIIAVMVTLLMSGNANADNDDLAFDFVSAEENQTVLRCYQFGDISNFEYNQTKYWPSDEMTDCNSIKVVAKQAQSKISVDNCYKSKVYTKKMMLKVKHNEDFVNVRAIVFYSLGDFCQQVYDELYPNEYEANKMIRGIVK